jgi:plasmid stabilization system protein ParE
MATALRELEISRAALRDFHHIAKHIEDFGRIRELALTLGVQPGIARLAEKVEILGKLEYGEVRDLLRGLLHLYRSAKVFKLSPSDFVEVMTASFKTKARTEEDKRAFTLWEQKKDQISRAVDSFGKDDVFLLSEKAGRITYAHQNIFKDAQILTDLRPVFNEDATSVIQAIVTHALYLEYFDGTETRRVELTLDAPDLAALKRLCIRAEQKAITAKEALKPLNAVVFNEWDESKHE